MPFREIFLLLTRILQKNETDFAQYLCGFPDAFSEKPRRYWVCAGWNLGQYCVVEYDQRPGISLKTRISGFPQEGAGKTGDLCRR